MGEQQTTKNTEHLLLGSVVESVQEKWGGPPLLRSHPVRGLLLLIALSTTVIGLTGCTLEGTYAKAAESPIAPSPSTQARNFVETNSGSTGRTGTSQGSTKADSLEWKLGTYVLNAYINAEGLSEPTREDLNEIAGEICSDIRAGGQGNLYDSEFVPSDEVLIELATALNYAYATSTECALSSNFTVGNNLRTAMLDLALNDDKLPAPENSNFDSTVLCNDGTISDAGGSQGACSWHGGVND